VPPPSSVGKPVSNRVNRIVDPATGRDAAVSTEGHREPGELWAKGPNVMIGPLNNDVATADTLDAVS
jgi:long-subunit acyl-CoA synthetase (AMP-forming)